MSRLMFEKHIENLNSSNTDPEVPAFNIVKLNNNLYTNASNNHRARKDWEVIIPGSAFFEGVDPVMGQIIIMVYEDPDTRKISTVLFSSLGEMCYNSLTLDHKSRFFAACENLRDELKKSNVRRALAVTLLKTYGSLTGDLKSELTKSSPTKDWDETTAGELASTMELVRGQSPEQIGFKLMDLGFLQPHFIESTVLDVIYEDNPEVIEANNELVYLLGEQVEQLFDPLTEYSPENKIISYETPDFNNNRDDGLTRSICSELLQFQENTTHVLIEFLQEFVIPMRIKVLKNEIKGLDITKLNQIFPPTIDEVTRINCILLEALQKSIPFGSFEVVKACGTTIPYFYKAYIRHESAMKSFSHLLKGFRYEYSVDLQPQFSERRIESIMNVSLNLTKIKLILERLINIKSWDTEEENNQVKIYYQNSVETIDAFAKDDLKPYSKRVFTPSGKVLTEICDGIPPLLTYGWLNRKVVSVLDAKNLISNEDDVIILFNDYVIFAKVDQDDIDEYSNDKIKPHVSDILMNSLMNEKPMKNIPNLKIRSWSDIGGFETITFGNNNIKIMLNEKPQDTLIYKVEDSTKFMNLLNKSKILNKSTPFHLFKNVEFGFTIYSAAHERKIFSRETSTSSVALFLNIDVDERILDDYKLFAGISAKFVDEEMIRVQGLTVSGERSRYTINSSEFSSFISAKLSSLELLRHNFRNNQIFTKSLLSNTTLLRSIVNLRPDETTRKSLQLSQKRSSIGKSVTNSRNPSIASCNKPLPKIVDNSKSSKVNAIREVNDPKCKKHKLKNRLSQIFSTKKSKSVENLAPVNVQGQKYVTATEIPPKIVPEEEPSDSESDIDEVNSMEDCMTFESSMTPVFDEEDDLNHVENVQSLTDGVSSENWLLARDNSSKNFGLKFNDPIFKVQEPVIEYEPQDKVITAESNDNCALKEIQVPKEDIHSLSTPITSRKLPTFNSLDDEFKTPILRVGYDSTEDLNADEKDDDIFYTPKSFGDEFPEFESMESLVSQKFNELSKEQRRILDSTNVGPKNGSLSTEIPKLTTTGEISKPISLHSSPSFASCNEQDSSDNFDMNSLIWKSPSQLNFSRLYEDNIVNDESFGYLAELLDNSCIITEGLRSSETYKTLPRSYSSIKYLGAYIDNDTPISQELLDFLEN